MNTKSKKMSVSVEVDEITYRVTVIYLPEIPPSASGPGEQSEIIIDDIFIGSTSVFGFLDAETEVTVFDAAMSKVEAIIEDSFPPFE